MKKYLLAALLASLIPFYGCHAQDGQNLNAQPFPVAMDKMLTPEIGGIKQFVEIKTDDARKPILLFLSGGPGSSMMRNAPAFTNILKDRFTIVQWDQRDAGKTLDLNPSPTRPSVALMERDTLQVVEFLIKELKQEKIYLLGSSWGNVLGFSVVRNHPELLHAYFAVNPVVNQLPSETALLNTLKLHFKDDPVATKELGLVDLSFKADEDLFYLRKWLFVKEGQKFATGEDFKTGFLQWSKAWSPVWGEVMTIDLPRTLEKVDCPVYFFVGKNDVQTLTAITEGYFNSLKAPKKELFVFENSGHQIHRDEPEKFQKSIIQTLN
jgi:pimeloyl-ACP methyl ester carboxylesterase